MIPPFGASEVIVWVHVQPSTVNQQTLFAPEKPVEVSPFYFLFLSFGHYMLIVPNESFLIIILHSFIKEKGDRKFAQRLHFVLLVPDSVRAFQARLKYKKCAKYARINLKTLFY